MSAYTLPKVRPFINCCKNIENSNRKRRQE
jgi:hypothetical protein